MNDHSGALVLQSLHCWGRCNTWNYYGCRNPKMTGRISCCHPSISSCWVQKCQRLKHTNAPTEAKDSSETDIFLSAESPPEQQTNRSHPRSAHYKEKEILQSSPNHPVFKLEPTHCNWSTQASSFSLPPRTEENYSQLCKGVRCP